MLKVGSDFSGVGAFNQSLNRVGVEYKEVFACDMDKYARITYIHNYGEPEDYPLNVYDRKIPKESLDIYMTSPPCQAFSLAGKRLGKNDKRGILFFNSLELIRQNKPRYFIFENVKGLLSDDGGKTFNEWVNYLGGKSVNGNPVMFKYEDSVNYHLYWKVLNAKNHGVPQNRERVFLIGIRDDKDNVFSFPKEEPLKKRLKDVLEVEVDEKYFLSEKMLSYLETRHGRIGKQVAQTLDTQCDQWVMIADYRADEGIRIRKDNISPCMTSSMKDYPEWNEKAGTRNPPLVGYANRIRRLTPRECFRLMDFPDTFDFSCVSDSQAYKQAGNSIVVNVLYKILKNLKL